MFDQQQLRNPKLPGLRALVRHNMMAISAKEE